MHFLLLGTEPRRGGKPRKINIAAKGHNTTVSNCLNLKEILCGTILQSAEKKDGCDNRQCVQINPAPQAEDAPEAGIVDQSYHACRRIGHNKISVQPFQKAMTAPPVTIKAPPA